MNLSLRERGVLAFDRFRLDPTRRTLRLNGQEVPLTARLFDTLLYLVQNPERLVTRDELENAVWGGRVVEEGNLQKAISSLRKALLADGAADGFIVTVPGRGFRFAVPVSFEPEAVGAAWPGALADTEVAGSAGAPLPTRSRRPWAALALGAVVLAVACGAAWHFAGRPAPFEPPPHSVAVLAFANMSGDPNQAYFADGLAEEVINALSAVNQLKVAARVSAFSFRDTNATATDIAHRLNVGAVLEGSVRRDGGRVRIAASLIDARTGFQIWSRSFDRDEHDLLVLEREIATEVSAALQIALAPGETARLTLGGTSNPQAFDLFLHGMLLARSMQEGNLQKAIDTFDQAIALDPAYAYAYSARSVQILNLALGAPPDTSQKELAVRYAAALASAEKAINLAPDLAAGHGARAIILTNGYLRNAEAMAEASQARALEPGNAAIVANYAQVAIGTGHAKDALDAARQATTLDPLRPDVWYIEGYVLFMAGQFDDVLIATQHEKSLRGTLPEHSMLLVALSQYLKGNLMEAAQACPGVGPDYIDECFALVDHASGKTDSAQAHLAHFRAQSADANLYQFAQIAAQWGDIAGALDLLETAKTQNDPALSDAITDPLLDPIRQEPRFRALLRAVSEAR